jgi:hypothetical protein
MTEERKEFTLQMAGDTYVVEPMQYAAGAVVIGDEGEILFQLPAWPDEPTAAVAVGIYLRGLAVGRRAGRAAAQFEIRKALGMAFGPSS